MRISTRARYALRLMIDLADNHVRGTPVILRDVARRQRISRRYLEQLATSLRNARLVSAVQGRGGGYTLQRAPEQIEVVEIVSATIGPINVVQCVRSPELCPRSDDCPSRRMWVRINEQINDVFSAVTLADLRETDACRISAGLDCLTPCTSAVLTSSAQGSQ